MELLNTPTPMEYCREFNGIKEILEYCDKHIKPFNKLVFRAGNETHLREMARRLQKCFAEYRLLDQDNKWTSNAPCTKLRKILMFLILNTDTTYMYNLHDDNNIVHVLDICPLIPKFLLMAFIWEFNLDEQFYEMLSFSPCWFSFQYIQPAIDSLKYITDPFEVLKKVHELLQAIFISITRSTEVYTDSVDLKIIHNKLSEYSMNLLRFFHTPEIEKIENFRKKQFHKYIGFALMHLLQLILYAFDVYEEPSLTAPPENLDIYNICPNSIRNTKINVDFKLLKEHKLKIIYALLNALQNNVMMINVDIYIYWVEVTINDNDNLQTIIGNMAYDVGERILTNTDFNHNVATQLKNIAIRPKSLQETLSDAKIGDILLALDKKDMVFHIKKAWFDELLCRDIALGNEECLEAIKQHIKLMNVDNCKKILDFIKIEFQRHNANNNENLSEHNSNFNMDIISNDYDDLVEIILKAIQNFNVKQILALLEYQAKLFGFSTSIFLQVDTVQRLTEFFNKYNTECNTFDHQQFLVIAFEHPQLVWQKFFDCASHNKIHISNYCSTVKLALPISNNYYLIHLEDALQDTNQLQQRYLPNLLCELYYQLYYPDKKTEFLKEIIHKYINCYLDLKQFECVLQLVRSLNLIGNFKETQSYKPLNFGEITAPVLLMAAQIMDKARWDLITYTDVRDELVRECIEFIQNTSKKFLPKASEKDREWIAKVISGSYKPVTEYYFQRFSLSIEENPMNFDQYLARQESQDQSEIEMLLKNYVRCTMKETEWLMRNERLLHHISDVMLILSGVINETENINSINNYRHCLVNYANIVQKYILPNIAKDNKKIEKCILKVLKIISATPSPIYEETFLAFESLILTIMKTCNLPISEDFAAIIRKSIERMKDCCGKHILLEKFGVIINELN